MAKNTFTTGDRDRRINYFMTSPSEEKNTLRSRGLVAIKKKICRIPFLLNTSQCQPLVRYRQTFYQRMQDSCAPRSLNLEVFPLIDPAFNN